MRSENFLKSLPETIQSSVECAGGWISIGLQDAAECQCPKGVDRSEFMELATKYSQLKDEDDAAKFAQLEAQLQAKAEQQDERDRRRQNELTYGE